MSPEQCLGNKLDACSDIYAFGCVMYETLAGQPPFSSENSIKTILKHLDGEVPPFSRTAKQQAIPADLEYVVRRCLEKSPVDRYESMHDLQSDLQKLKNGEPIARVHKPEIFTPERVDPRTFYRQMEATRAKPMSYGTTFSVIFILLALVAIGAVSISEEKLEEANYKSAAYKSTPSNTVPRYDYYLLMEKTDSFVEKIEDLARGYIAAKEYDKALPLLEMASQHYRDSKIETTKLADVLEEIGFCYKMKGDYPKALTNYMSALSIYQDRYSDEYIAQSKEPAAVLTRRCIKQLQEVLIKLNRGAEAFGLNKKWHI